MNRWKSFARRGIVIGGLVVLASCGSRDPRTPEEARARGDELLRAVSDTLGKAQAFSFKTVESIERVRRNGQKETLTVNREVIVRRPDRLWFHATGSDGRNLKLTYDGKTITVVGDTQKIHATVNARPTLDETLDLASDRYDISLPVADFLYSTPYDSFADKESKGGWVRRVDVNGRSCEEMTYAMENVDFTLSVTADSPVLPCQLQIVQKKEPSQPVTRLTFSDWNLNAQPQDAQFVAQVPQGYELIPVIERIPKEELKADPAKAMGAQAPR
jgi:hypothetical protein